MLQWIVRVCCGAVVGALFGAILAYHVIYFCELALTVATGDAAAAPDDPGAKRLRRIHRLPDGVWRTLRDDLQRGETERKVKLRICSMYAVDASDGVRRRFDAATAALSGPGPNVRQLYHGTRHFDAVRAIAEGGFKLPPSTSRNMFGPGVYFASVPQKSYNYTRVGSGYILICRVALGRPKRVKIRTTIDPARDLKTRHRVFWTRPCNSVHAPAGASTISDEHVLFNTDQMLPCFLLSVSETP
jgi:hypothetical protein